MHRGECFLETLEMITDARSFQLGREKKASIINDIKKVRVRDTHKKKHLGSREMKCISVLYYSCYSTFSYTHIRLTTYVCAQSLEFIHVESERRMTFDHSKRREKKKNDQLYFLAFRIEENFSREFPIYLLRGKHVDQNFILNLRDIITSTIVSGTRISLG